MKRRATKQKERAPRPRYFKCQFCTVDPNTKEHAGRQVYACDKCDANVCTGCAVGGPDFVGFFRDVPNPVLCDPCAYELLDLRAEQLGLR